MNYTEGIDAAVQYPADARAAVERGFRAMKMRIGRFEPRREFPMFAAVRAAVGPDIKLMADGNSAYTFKQAVQVGRELERLGFYWFEEPIPLCAGRYPGYAGLKDQLDIPLAGGEVIDGRGAAFDLLRRNLFDILQPDSALCGGLSECLFIAEMAEQFGVLCTPHCWAGAIAIAASVHLLSVLPNHTWSPISDSPMLELDQIESHFRDKLCSKPVVIQDGFAQVPTGPGLGIEVDEDVIRRYRKR
jgi:D-galactarolactone cycloisomerase